MRHLREGQHRSVNHHPVVFGPFGKMDQSLLARVPSNGSPVTKDVTEAVGHNAQQRPSGRKCRRPGNEPISSLPGFRKFRKNYFVKRNILGRMKTRDRMPCATAIRGRKGREAAVTGGPAGPRRLLSAGDLSCCSGRDRRFVRRLRPRRGQSSNLADQQAGARIVLLHSCKSPFLDSSFPPH